MNVTKSGLLLRPPSGKWMNSALSICSAGEEFVVTYYDDRVLDTFNSAGKILLLSINVIIVRLFT